MSARERESGWVGLAHSAMDCGVKNVSLPKKDMRKNSRT